MKGKKKIVNKKVAGKEMYYSVTEEEDPPREKQTLAQIFQKLVGKS